MAKGKENIQDIYPLSPMQKGMLFHCLFSPETDVYFTQLYYTLNGPLDVAALKQAWETVVDRHEILRTLFVAERAGEPLQIVRKKVTLPWLDLDWTALDPAEQETKFVRFLEEDRQLGFAMNEPPLMRCAVIRMTPLTVKFVWSVHHILMDGWCQSPLIKEVMTCYEHFRAGHTPNLPKPRPFKDYIRWLGQQDLQAAEDYWRTALRGRGTPGHIVQKQPADLSDKGYGKKTRRLSREESDALRDLARRNHITLNTLAQGAYALLLSRLLGSNDILFGATMSGRPTELSGVEDMVGLFINTLPIRIRVDEERHLPEWLAEIQEQAVEVRRFEHTPLYEIRNWTGLSQHPSLFDNIFVFENYPVDTSLDQDAGAQSEVSVGDVGSYQRNSFPFTLLVGPAAELILIAYHDLRFFDDAACERLMTYYKNLLLSMAQDPEARLKDLAMKTAEEKRRDAEQDAMRKASKYNRFKTTKPRIVGS